MAYDAELAGRVREALAGRRDLTEKKMFGGLAFMLGGHMCCGALNADLVVRVGPEAYQDALNEPHARPMDFIGRPLKGFVYVGPQVYRTGRDLRRWLKRGLDFAGSLPPK